jgi:hypothetical protein
MTTTTTNTKSLEWGLQPPEGVDAPLWGARAIYSVDFIAKHGPRVTIELLWDRQSAIGEDKIALRALGAWIDEKGLELIRRVCLDTRLRPSDSQRVTFHDEADGYTIEADPRASHGYLYLCAYRSHRVRQAP